MRISLFLDGANFFYMQRDRLHWWIDLRKLLEFVRAKGELVDAFYYIGVDVPPDARQQAYLDTVTRLGFALVTKQLKTIMQADGTSTQKANLDIEIVLDMFNTIDHYDLAILVSGDGDFERPLQLLRARGKRFLVLSTLAFVARELREVAGMHYSTLRISASTWKESEATEKARRSLRKGCRESACWDRRRIKRRNHGVSPHRVHAASSAKNHVPRSA